MLSSRGVDNYVEKRSSLLPEKLYQTDSDIIFLQEVWQNGFEHPDFVADVFEKKYNYHTAFVNMKTDDTPFGSGIMILSKFPIVEGSIEFVPWSSKDITSEKARESRKGTLAVTIEVPEMGRLQLFNTHTSAQRFDKDIQNYVELPKDQSGGDARSRQLDLLIQTMQKYRSQNNYCQVLGGDLNTHIYEWDANSKGWSNKVSPYISRITETLRLVPDFENRVSLNSQDDLSLVSDKGNTWEQDNRWVLGGLFPKNPSSKIDYIFYQLARKVSGQTSYCVYGGYSQVVLKENVEVPTSLVKDGVPIIFKAPLSDHYGVKSYVTFKKDLR